MVGLIWGGRCEQPGIIVKRALFDLGKCRSQLLGGLFVAHRLQRPGGRLRRQDTLHRLAVVGVIAAGMPQRQVDVVAGVTLLEV